ncbi:MAG: hypothetical protein ABSE79_10205 [Terriglobia bacterium]|jgi:hypothetical protein
MIKEIALQMKLIEKPSNAVKAVCDVSIHFQELGVIEVCGFRVIERDEKTPWVSAPSRQGERTWFDVVKLRGPIKSAVEEAILREFDRRRRESQKN